MATEKAANKAREQFAQDLFDQGVHALQVDALEGGKAFCLIAHVPQEFGKTLPNRLNVSLGTKKVEVPLVVRKSEPFKPE